MGGQGVMLSLATLCLCHSAGAQVRCEDDAAAYLQTAKTVLAVGNVNTSPMRLYCESGPRRLESVVIDLSIKIELLQSFWSLLWEELVSACLCLEQDEHGQRHAVLGLAFGHVVWKRHLLPQGTEERRLAGELPLLVVHGLGR